MMAQEHAYALAVEKLLGIELLYVPNISGYFFVKLLVY